MTKPCSIDLRRQTFTRKRIVVATSLLPLTLPFALLHRLIEWWHFSVSQALVLCMRAAAKRRDRFFESFSPKPLPIAPKETK